MSKSAISFLVFILVFCGLMFIMLYTDRHLSNSVADRRLHLTRSLRQANMPAEQASALVDAVDGVGREANSILMTVFLSMAAIIAMAFADIYDLHRRLKKLESKPEQPSPAFQTDG